MITTIHVDACIFKADLCEIFRVFKAELYETLRISTVSELYDILNYKDEQRA
jgi:hypothetical protein